LLLVAIVAVVANVGALALSILSIAPAPRPPLWLIGIFAQGSSLLVVVAGLIGLGLATAAGVLGAAVLGAVAGTAALATIVVGALPIWWGLRLARREETRLSLRDYVARPTWAGKRTPAAAVFASPPDIANGLTLDVLTPPPTGGTRRRGAVVLVHGGGWVSGGRGGTARWNEWLADRGYVVFDIDYRLAPPARWCDAPGDVKAAVTWVRANATEYGVDPTQIALVGWSAGGHLALLAAYTAGHARFPCTGPGEDQPVAAVAAFYPDTDVTVLPRRKRPHWSSDGPAAHVIDFLGAPPAAAPERARESSPLTHARADVPPTLLIHGRHDQLVAPDQSARLAAELRARGAVVEHLELPGANHSFDLSWGAWSTQLARARLGRFLDRHLAASP
jgi:acetyl esterase/lipase